MNITLDDEINEVGREIGLRKSVYPQLVVSGKLTQVEAERHLSIMQAVYSRLQAIRTAEPGQLSLL